MAKTFAFTRQSQSCCYFRFIWRAYADGEMREKLSVEAALQSHRELIFGKRAADAGVSEMSLDYVSLVLPGIRCLL